MTTVINFAAGPSAGKTTNGLGLAYRLKLLRKDVLYVPEFAMQMVVQDRLTTLDDQLYIFAKQANKLYDALDQFEFVVTDAPLFMMLHYMENAQSKFDTNLNVGWWNLSLTNLILDTYNMHNNITFFVERGDREFRQAGRIQNKEESIAIDNNILKIMNENEISYRSIADLDEVLDILKNDGVI